jgi:hypothetical protein
VSERYRIAATADGGVWVLNTPYPEPLTGLAGQRRVLQTARRMVGATWGDEGTTREHRVWIADPELIRRLDVGQACYIHRGAATFVQVARPRPSPLTLTAGSPGGDGTTGGGQRGVRLPAPRREANPAVESAAESATDWLDHVTGSGGAA